MIISASRRCDIPRFRFDWFLERLNEGFADVANPYNAAQIKRVSLKPEDAEFLVFWTRDPRSLVNAPAVLEKYPFYIMITVTGYPKIFEPDMPAFDEIAGALKELADRWGRNRVVWRYDPVLLTSITDCSFHKKNFSELCARLSGYVKRVIISVYDEYTGSKRRLSGLEREGICKNFFHYSEDGHLLLEVMDLLAELALIAKDAGIEMRSCAEKDDLSSLGIKPGSCIDGSLISEISGSLKWSSSSDTKDKNQRPYCQCVPSVDIGSYGSCPAGCVYCYARR